MTTTNMFLNFGGKWDSPPMVNGLKGVQDYRKVQNKSTIKNLSKGNYDSSLDFGGLNPPPHPTNLHL